MPEADDVEVLRRFIDHTTRTYVFVLDNFRQLRRAERESLDTALREFELEQHPERIVGQYEGSEDEDIRDAGLYGQQLRQKYEMARLAARDLGGGPDAIARPRAFSRRKIRHWIKRAKVLVGSLLKGVPGAEALSELLDLLDGALDAA